MRVSFKIDANSFAYDHTAPNTARLPPQSTNNIRQLTSTICTQRDPLSGNVGPSRLFHENEASSVREAAVTQVVKRRQQ